MRKGRVLHLKTLQSLLAKDDLHQEWFIFHMLIRPSGSGIKVVYVFLYFPMDHHFKKIETLFLGYYGQVMSILPQQFSRILSHYLYIFIKIFPWIMDESLISKENKWTSFTQRWFVPIFVEISLMVLKKRLFKFVNTSHVILPISLLYPFKKGYVLYVYLLQPTACNKINCIDCIG